MSGGLSPPAGAGPWGGRGGLASGLNASRCLQGVTSDPCLRNKALHPHLIITAHRRKSKLLSICYSPHKPQDPALPGLLGCFQSHDCQCPCLECSCKVPWLSLSAPLGPHPCDHPLPQAGQSESVLGLARVSGA